MDEAPQVTDLEPLFLSLDDKESYCEKVDMKEKTVFYPYFEFLASKTEGNKANRIRIVLRELGVEKLIGLERALFPGRSDEYGCWTAYSGAGSLIGMGASSLGKTLSLLGDQEVRFVVSKGSDLVYAFSFNKKGADLSDGVLDVYVSNANAGYEERFRDVSAALEAVGIIPPGAALMGEAVEYKAATYLYGGEKTGENCVICAAKEPSAFKENVSSCAWHAVRFNEEVIKEGPRFVLLKNPGIKMGNALDGLSSWLVHRRGGFVMAPDLDSNDFCDEATFCIKEVDEYRFGDIVILNIECETYTKSRDKGFDDFLKSISDERLRRK